MPYQPAPPPTTNFKWAQISKIVLNFSHIKLQKQKMTKLPTFANKAFVSLCLFSSLVFPLRVLAQPTFKNHIPMAWSQLQVENANFIGYRLPSLPISLFSSVKPVDFTSNFPAYIYKPTSNISYGSSILWPFQSK